MFSDILKLQTQSQHEALHQVVCLDKMLLTIQDYTLSIQAFYRCIHNLESAAAEFIHANPQLPPPQAALRLQKTDWLCRDLRSLNVSPLAVESNVELRVHNQSELAGRLYVLEGMTLGGRQIARQVQSSNLKGAAEACRFFQGYGEQTGTMWLELKDWLNIVEINSGIAIHSAKNTFATFSTTFAEYLASAQAFDCGNKL